MTEITTPPGPAGKAIPRRANLALHEDGNLPATDGVTPPWHVWFRRTCDVDVTPDVTTRTQLGPVLGTPMFEADLDGDMPRAGRPNTRPNLKLVPDLPLDELIEPTALPAPPRENPREMPLWTYFLAGSVTGSLALFATAILAFGAAALFFFAG